MKFSVVLERVSDGRRVEVPQDYAFGEEDGATEFYWSDGNMACDCSRRRLFYQAIGEDKPEPADPCTMSEFRLIEFRLADGRVILGGEKP